MKRTVAVLMALVMALGAFAGCQPKKTAAAVQEKKPLLYVKNGSLYSMGSDNKPDQIIDRFPSQSEEGDSSPFWYASVGLVTSPSCKYLAYSTQTQSDSDFRTLFVARTDRSDVRLVTSQIPSELLRQVGPDLRRYYCFSDKQDLLYFLQYDAQELRTDLYAWKDGEVTRIKENVTEFYLDENEQKILCVGPTIRTTGALPEDGTLTDRLKAKYNYSIKQLSVFEISSGREEIISRQFVDEMDIQDEKGFTKLNFVEEDANGDRSYKCYQKGHGVVQKDLEEAAEVTKPYKVLLELEDGSYIGADDKDYYFVPAQGDAQLLFSKKEMVGDQESMVTAKFLLSENQQMVYFAKDYSVADKYGVNSKLYSGKVRNGKVEEITLIDEGSKIDFSPAAGDMGVFYSKNERNEYNRLVDNVYYYKGGWGASPAFLGEDFNLYTSVSVGGKLYISRNSKNHLDYYNINRGTPVLYQDKAEAVLTCNNSLYVLKAAGKKYDVYLGSERVVLGADKVIEFLGTGCYDYADIFVGL